MCEKLEQRQISIRIILFFGDYYYATRTHNILTSPTLPLVLDTIVAVAITITYTKVEEHVLTFLPLIIPLTRASSNQGCIDTLPTGHHRRDGSRLASRPNLGECLQCFCLCRSCHRLVNNFLGCFL